MISAGDLMFQFDAKITRELRAAYDKAIRATQAQFRFREVTFTVADARRLLEYLERQFPKEVA